MGTGRAVGTQPPAVLEGGGGNWTECGRARNVRTCYRTRLMGTKRIHAQVTCPTYQTAGGRGKLRSALENTPVLVVSFLFPVWGSRGGPGWHQLEVLRWSQDSQELQTRPLLSGVSPEDPSLVFLSLQTALPTAWVRGIEGSSVSPGKSPAGILHWGWGRGVLGVSVCTQRGLFSRWHPSRLWGHLTQVQAFLLEEPPQ